MANKNLIKAYRLLPVAAALLAAFGDARAQEGDEVKDLISPDSSVSIGVGVPNNTQDAKRFGQYTGMNQGSIYGLADFDFTRRDDASGTWTMAQGRDLGLDTRELSFSQQKQGDWKYKLGYNEIVRNDPYVIHTGMTGIGSPNPVVNLIAQPPMPAAWATGSGSNQLVAPASPAPAYDVSLKLKRKGFDLSGEKWITPELEFQLSFRNETKQGARMFGRGGLDSSDMGQRPNATGASANGGWAVLLTPEPIDSTTRQIESRLNWSRDSLAVSAGYYGSFYTNNYGNLSPVVPGVLNRGPLWTNCATAGCSTVQQIASSPVALPPDNQAHQLYLSGTYAYSHDTRGSFKLAYTHASQSDSVAAMGLTPALTAPGSLGGVVDTKLAQFGLSMRPAKNLSLNASLRYEDRADRTPVYVYNTNGIAGSALNNTTNWPSGSQTRTSAKLDGIYRLPAGYSLMFGADWERKATPLPPPNTALFANQVLFRPKLDEYGLHGELRKNLSETLNGALAFEYKQRRGNDNDWVTTSGVTNANPATSNTLVPFYPGSDAVACTANAAGTTYTCSTIANRVLPQMYMDRNRTRLRADVDWQFSEKASMQAALEHTQDDFLRGFPTVVSGSGSTQAAAQAALKPTQDIPTVPGARTVISDSLSLDSTWQLSEDWRLNGFWTFSYNRWNVNKANLGDDTRNTTNTVGLGLNGNATARLALGVNLLATSDITTFANTVVNSPTSALAGTGNIAGWTGQTLPGNFLPNIHYKTQKLDLFARYAIAKNADVQANLGFQHFTTDDWQWSYNGVPFLYSDNTTVSQPTNQHLVYVAARYIYKFK